MSFFKLRYIYIYIYIYIKFGYKGEIVPKLLILFFDGFHWRIFLLLRANRLYAIFNTGLKNSGPSCLRYSFVFYPEYWVWFVSPLRTLPNNSLFYFLFPLTGRSLHFRFGVSANHLASLFLPLVGRFLRATRCHQSRVTQYR